MANFLEFLKSGKTAREFIDTSILPQHVLPVKSIVGSPDQYDPEHDTSNTEATDAVLDSAIDEHLPEPPSSEDRAVDFDDLEIGGNDEYLELKEDDGDTADSDFLAALEAAEEDGIE